MKAAGLVVVFTAAALILLALLLWPRGSSRPVASINGQPDLTNQLATQAKVETPSAASALPPVAPVLDGGRPQEEIVGIGAVLSRPDNDGLLRITKVLPNSPSEAAGLSGPLDIHKIDGISVRGLSLQECVAMLRGAVGTKVRIELSQPSEEGTFEVEITRQRVVISQ